MKKLLFIILIGIFTLASCSIPIKAETLSQSSIPQESTVDLDDGFDDDFADEFEEVQKVFDPLSGYNRGMTTINDKLFINVMTPVTNVYSTVMSKNIRTGVFNVFNNILFPIRFINNILQFKFYNATEELGRFTINSTIGLLGIMDLALKFDLKPHKEDFGQTLGFYGVGGGFPIVIPFIGPSNLRDFTGDIVDSFANPLSLLMPYEPYVIPNNTLEEFGYRGYILINEYSLNPTTYEDIKKEAIDLYPFLRDIYEQRRDKLIEE